MKNMCFLIDSNFNPIMLHILQISFGVSKNPRGSSGFGIAAGSKKTDEKDKTLQ